MKCCSKCGQPLPQVLRDRYGTEIKVSDVLLWVPALKDEPAKMDGAIDIHGCLTLVILDKVYTNLVGGTYQLQGHTRRGMPFDQCGYLDTPVNEVINLHTTWGTITEGLDTL